MNQYVLKLWVAALRSGKYKEGYGMLRYRNKYDALGVLCDLCPLGFWSKDDNNWIYETGEDDFSSFILPKEVAEWAGIDQEPTVEMWGCQMPLTRLVDWEGFSHKVIARVLELNFELEENVYQIG